MLAASDPRITPQGLVGTGVNVDRIERIRDPLLDSIYRRESSFSSSHGERADQLNRLEQTFGEPSDSGLLETLDRFWNAWSDLAVEPLSEAARSVVRERGIELSDRLHQLSSGLTELRTSGTERLETLTSRVNDLSTHLAELNGRIVAAEAAGGTAGDLRDARDNALDELSTIVAVQVVPRESGAIAVHVEGQVLVDGTTSRQLETGTQNGATRLRFAGGGAWIQDPGGRIGGLISYLDGELQDAQTRVDDFTANLVTEVNLRMAPGVNEAGNSGVEFFDPAGLTAETIQLSAAVMADAAAIPAGSGDGSGNYQAATNDVALSLEALREEPVGGLVLADRYSDLVSRTGAKLSAAESSHTVHDTLTQQADIRRMEISGVSVDEELTMMIKHQAAYSAAARVVTRVDEMLQTLLSIG